MAKKRKVIAAGLAGLETSLHPEMCFWGMLLQPFQTKEMQENLVFCDKRVVIAYTHWRPSTLYFIRWWLFPERAIKMQLFIRKILPYSCISKVCHEQIKGSFLVQSQSVNKRWTGDFIYNLIICNKEGRLEGRATMSFWSWKHDLEKALKMTFNNQKNQY